MALLVWTPGPQDWEQGDQELATSRLGGSTTTASSKQCCNGNITLAIIFKCEWAYPKMIIRLFPLNKSILRSVWYFSSNLAVGCLLTIKRKVSCELSWLYPLPSIMQRMILRRHHLRFQGNNTFKIKIFSIDASAHFIKRPFDCCYLVVTCKLLTL